MAAGMADAKISVQISVDGVAFRDLPKIGQEPQIAVAPESVHVAAFPAGPVVAAAP
jgi:hypothetical protein